MNKAGFNKKELQKLHDDFYDKAIYKSYSIDWNINDIKEMPLPTDKPYYIKTVFGKKALEETEETYSLDIKLPDNTDVSMKLKAYNVPELFIKN